MPINLPNPEHDETPLDPDLAVRLAGNPELDPITRVRCALDAGFRNPDFTQKEAAELAGVGSRRLRYLLTQGDTNYRLEIDRRRMAYAQHLLLTEPKFLVSAVGKLSGYRNASAFCKRFKEKFGMTPAGMRSGVAGGPKRSGGPTGATKNPAARARAREAGEPVPSTRRIGWGPGEQEAFDAEYDNAVRQARAFGLLPRHDDISISEASAVRGQKRRRGAPE